MCTIITPFFVLKGKKNVKNLTKYLRDAANARGKGE